MQQGLDFTVTEGDHSSDPRSIEFFQMWGITSISCSAKRVPIVRICAAQAAIREATKGETCLSTAPLSRIYFNLNSSTIVLLKP